MKLYSTQFIKNIKALLIISWQEDRFLFSAYFFSAFLGAFFMYVVYFVYKLMIDQVAQQVSVTPSTSLVIVICSYLFFEYLSRFVNFTFNQYYFDYFVKAKLQNALTRKFMEKLSSMDFAQLENGETRNLIAKVENTYAFRLPEILHTLNAVVYNIAALVFSLLIAFRFNMIYFVILALVSAPIYYLRAKYGNMAWAQYSAQASNTNYLWYLRSLFTNFQTLSEMKIYSLSDHFLEKTKILQDKVLTDYQKPITVYTILSTFSFILIPVAIYFAINHFLLGMAQSIYSLGDFTFFLNTLFTFSGQISSILINVGSVSENSLYLNDYFKLQNIENSLTIHGKPKVFPSIMPREIVFRNVSFTYPGAKYPSLTNINLTIQKGEDVAIVGQNGAGKSTLIKLLFRFYDPTEGQILIDGIDLKSIPLQHWYSHIGVLFQDYARYYVTLKENIQFGRLENDSHNDVDDALFQSQAEDLLTNLPNGYKQILGRWFDKGQELSGGQWQKVAIARAIFRKAPILIMDEPTASIDADSESNIFQNLKTLYKDKNLLFISHRFSTVRMAHKIYVLEKGGIAESGTHNQLITNKSLYKRFFNLQKRGYE